MFRLEIEEYFNHEELFKRLFSGANKLLTELHLMTKIFVSIAGNPLSNGWFAINTQITTTTVSKINSAVQTVQFLH